MSQLHTIDCVSRAQGLDKGYFMLYLCIDILIDQSVNPQAGTGSPVGV